MLGKTVLGYRVDEEIGQGGFGTVYKVSKSNIAGTEIRALKHISIPSKKQYLDVLNSMGGDHQKADDYFVGVLKNVINEIRIIRSMSAGRTANIVTYYENDIEEHGSPRTYDVYILMEYLTSLSDHAAAHRLTVRDVVRLAKDMLSALDQCHSNDIIHRDIKEDNIFVSPEGIFKLGDFGVSRVLKDRSGAESMKGTPNYIAPEVYLGKEKYDNTVDLYSLGIVLYRMLNMSRGPFMPAFPAPYTGEDEDLAFEKRMKYMTPDLPCFADNELGRTVIRAISPRSERYAGAGEFLDAVIKAEAALTEDELNTCVTSGVTAQPVEITPCEINPTMDETFGSDIPVNRTSDTRKEEPNRFQTISDTYSDQRRRSIPEPPAEPFAEEKPSSADRPFAESKSFSVDSAPYRPAPPPETAYRQERVPETSGRSDERKTLMYAVPVVIIALYIIMNIVVRKMLSNAGVSAIEWLFHNAADIAETIRSGEILDVMSNVDIPNIPLAGIYVIKLLNWALLVALIASLYMIGRSLHFKKPEVNSAAVLRGNEAYIRAMEIWESMKRSESPETLKARNAVKLLLERLRNESAFGTGSAQVIVCENEIAACLDSIERNVPGLFNENTAQLAADNIEAQCEKIRSKLRVRIELKKK